MFCHRPVQYFRTFTIIAVLLLVSLKLNLSGYNLSQCMRFPTMWYVRPAKPQISLRIRAVWSEPLLVAWVFFDCWATDWTHLEFLSLKGGCTGSSESIHVKMPHCWKSHVAAHFIINYVKYAHFILSLFLSFFLLDIYLTLKQLTWTNELLRWVARWLIGRVLD